MTCRRVLGSAFMQAGVRLGCSNDVNDVVVFVFLKVIQLRVLLVASRFSVMGCILYDSGN